VRVLYLCSAQIPSRSTNALQVIRMCEAFQRAGSEVTLVHPSRIGNRPEGYDGDVWSFYSVETRFELVTLPVPLTWRAAHSPWIARPVLASSLGLLLSWRCRPGLPPFVCYGRSPLGAWLALRARRLWGDRSACRGVFLEVHDDVRSVRSLRLLAGVDGIVAISEALRDRLVERRPDLRDRISVEHDGVDLRLVSPELFGQDNARRRLGLSADGPIVVYTGRVNAAKGAGVLLDAAESLRDLGGTVVLVGKVYDAAYEQRASRLENVLLTGYVPPAAVPAYLASADVLALPTTPELAYARFTSPLKLFEYLASGRPVVASDLPVHREVLEHDVNALLYTPGDAAALAAAVRRLRKDRELGQRLAERAWQDVQPYAWDRRARRILARLRDAPSASGAASG
jgi:glycosyltransferase involved in cell wall biosynthesis